MALTKLNEQLDELIDSLIREGILSDYILELQSNHEPSFIAEILPMACKNTGKHLNHLEELLNEDIIDYEEVEKYALIMKDCIVFTGSLNVPISIDRICWHSRKKKKEGCMKAFNGTKLNLLHLQEKLDSIVQLLKQIAEVKEAKEKK